MGDVIDLAARRRLKEIESSICFIGETRVDPIDEELNRQFVEAQRRGMTRWDAARDQLNELCKVLEEIRDKIRRDQSDAPSSTS